MYDDDIDSLSPAMATRGPTIAYRPARFPTKNIATPIVLLYGTNDSLVDINIMRAQLPEHTEAKGLEGYEHVDILWGRNVDRDVIPEVLKALKKYCARVDGDTDVKTTTVAC
jgi:lysosomal acid lipase/cholesteryl ester hydrolase